MKKLFVVLALLLVANTAYAQEQYVELLKLRHQDAKGSGD